MEEEREEKKKRERERKKAKVNENPFSNGQKKEEKVEDKTLEPA